uniref:xenobiotic acyltransferase family protein n=1 Tax=Flavobacterium sp. TaxID=239 RepID=UPI00404A7D76
MINKIINKFKSILKHTNSINKKATISNGVKIKGAIIGACVQVNENSEIQFSNLEGNIKIGANCFIKDSKISKNFSTQEHCKIYGATLSGNIQMGRYSSLWGPNLDIISGNQQVTIGNFCSIARNVTFQTYNHNHKKLTTYFIGRNLFNEKWENETVSKGDVIIENDVWIGAHCVILGGITIGNGAVIAANSVVNKDIPPFAIVAGTPAKIIGYRFDDLAIKEIQDLQWWDWSLEKLEKNKHLFENEYCSHLNKVL